jgi:hypothetical protein
MSAFVLCSLLRSHFPLTAASHGNCKRDRRHVPPRCDASGWLWKVNANGSNLAPLIDKFFVSSKQYFTAGPSSCRTASTSCSRREVSQTLAMMVST